MDRRQFVHRAGGVILLGGFGSVLAACGGGANTGTGSETGGSPRVAPGGTLRIAHGGFPAAWDSALSNGSAL